MKKTRGVFLGGTCGNNPWREAFIERLLARGVTEDKIFNPVAPRGQWDEAFQAREDAAKRDLSLQMYLIANPREDRTEQSPYGLIQLVDSVFEVRTVTLAFFSTEFQDPKTVKALTKLMKDLEARAPGTIRTSWDDFVTTAASVWTRKQDMLAFLAGTSGNNPWRARLLNDLRARGVTTDRFFDPTVPAGTWNDGVQYLEDQMRKAANVELFYFGDPMEDRPKVNLVPTYSVVEAYTALFVDSERTVICFDHSEWEGHTLKAMRKFEADIRARFPNAMIASDLPQAEELLAARLAA